MEGLISKEGTPLVTGRAQGMESSPQTCFLRSLSILSLEESYPGCQGG